MDDLSWIEHVASPTCILSGDGTVLGANGGALRLVRTDIPCSGDANSLIGLSVQALGISLVPTQKPVIRNWDSLLEYLRTSLFEASDYDLQSSATMDNGDDDNDDDDDVDIMTSRFWQRERRNEIVHGIDCLVKRHLDTPTEQPLRRRGVRTPFVRARLEVYPRLTDDGRLNYVLHFFDRSLFSGAPSGTTQAAVPTTVSASLAAEMSSMQETSNLQNVVRFIPYIAGQADVDGQMIYLSPSWYEYSGLTEAESLGTGWAAVIHPDDLEPLATAWGEVVRNKLQSWTYDGARYRRFDGEYRYFLVRCESTKDEHGNHLGYYASQVELHDFILARRKTERQRQSVLASINTAELSLWELDKAMDITLLAGSLNLDLSTFMDREMLRSRGTVKHNLGIDNLTRSILDVSKGQSLDQFTEHQAAGRIYRTWLVPQVDDEDVHNPDVDSENQSLVRAVRGLTIDVTDVRARAELEIENAKLASEERAARKASEMKSNFLATMSHEIRTPIAGIIGLNELMSTTTLDTEQAQLCKDLKHSAEYLLTIINDILDFGKLDSGHLKIESIPFAVCSSIRDMQTFAIQADNKGLKLDLSCDVPADEMVIGDPHRLRQVLTNLISNSLKFTEKGTVSLKVNRLASRDDDDVLMSNDGESQNSSTMLEYVVSDTGIGIDKATLSTLFRPFKQADSSTARIYGGTGLGLTICKQLVELMGGHLTLDSVPGQGSTASVRLPFGTLDDRAVKAAAQSISQPKSAGAQQFKNLSKAKRKGIHVLIIEDNPINQKIALALVRQLGFSASACWNGAEALDYLARAPTPSEPLPAVVLCDCHMPVLDGYAATKQLRNDTVRFSQKLRRLPVIALTASAVQGEREKCLNAGMDDYMMKPLGKAALEEIILRYYQKGGAEP